MSAGFRFGNEPSVRCKLGRPIWRSRIMEYYPAAVTVFIGTLTALILSGAMKERMWPLLDAVVRAQTENRIVSVMERMVLTEIERLNADPTDFICVNRIKDGVISEITTNTTMINRLRSSLMERVTPELAKVDRHDLAVPLGSLFESELLWGRGPSIKIRALSVGRFRVEFESGFNAEEMNRTRYKLWLILSAPTTVFLFGDRVTMEVQTRLCVAETVVMGKISSDVQKASD